MTDIFTYSPQDVVLVVAGYQVKGWESVLIKRNKQGFLPVDGIRGTNTRVRNRNTSCTLIVPILQTQQANDVFSRIHELDLENGTGRLELTLTDKGGNSVFSSTEAFITSYPETVYSGNLEYRAWTIYCNTSQFYVGSNANTSFSLFSNLFNNII